MKKISLLKKVGIGLGSVCAATPLVLTATSCSNTSAVVTHYISFDRVREDHSLINMSNKRYTNDEVLLGTKSFSDGNYILFVGSNTFDTSKKFFTGSGEQRYTRDVHKWFYELYVQSIWWMDVVNYPNALKLNTKFGFATYLDDFDFRFYDKTGHEYFVSEDASKHVLGRKMNIHPFEKWSEGLIAQTKKYMKDDYNYDWDDEAVSTDDYIRTDAQAKAYRAFCERGAKMFPVNDTRTQTFVTGEEDKSLMVIYKDGRLQEIALLPSEFNKSDTPEKDKDSATLLGAINKYYADIEEEDPE